MTDRSRRSHLDSIAEGAGVAHHTLPERLADAKRADATIRERLAAARRRRAAVHGPEGVINRLSEHLYAAVLHGGPEPDMAAEVAAARAEEESAIIEVQTLELAAANADSAYLVSIRPDDFIRDHLQPAFAETMDAVRALRPVLVPYRVTEPERMLQAPLEARKALGTLLELVDRYQALRAARGHAASLAGGSRQDPHSDFAEFEHPDRLHGGRWASRAQMGLPTVGPEDARARLLWLVDCPGDVWMPTVSEQDAAALADREQAQSRNRMAWRAAGVAVG